MNFGQFYNTKSIIHQLDPRIKLLSLIIFGTQIFFIDSIQNYIVIICTMFFLVYLSHVPFKLFLKSTKSICSIILFTSILNIFFITNGNVIFKFFFLRITDCSLMLAIKMSLRLIILVFLTSLLTFTTSTLRLTDALVNILSPLKKILPTNEISMILSITLRFIPILSEEFKMIMKAQTMRGIDFKSKNINERIKNYLALLIPIFISAFRRADDLAFAMQARCYDPNIKRNSLKKLKLQAADFFAILFLIAFFFLTCFLENLKF